jgi:hypothetical protein
MLDVIYDYPFCSAACYEAIEVLDILKVAFDDDDIEDLKSFVKKNLSKNQTTHFTFKSGNRATSSNFATIVKIGLALKRLTTTTGNAEEEDSEDKPFHDESESDSN